MDGSDLSAVEALALTRLARGEPLAAALAELTAVAEAGAPAPSVAAILILDGAGRLWTGAAPGLPASYNKAIDGIGAAINLGTCAKAAATGSVVITPDIDTDPHWETLKVLPLNLGLVAAWSQPIIAADGRVLGTFGTYFRESREPTEGERTLVESLARIAGRLIERAAA